MTESKRIFAAVLAAGRAERFGTSKQLAEIDGRSLVQRALAAARACCGDHVLLVVGHDADRVIRSAGELSRFIVVNENYIDGMGASLAVAARTLAEGADAILVVLADQPFVDAAHLHKLCSAWDGSDDTIVATAFAGAQGPPILLPKSAFAELQALTGDAGARCLLADSRFRVTTVWNDAAAIDIDTPEDLDQATS